ncbi:MAG: hypothetical protein ACJ796_14505 [Gemmatimonadaceae bacterium]
MFKNAYWGVRWGRAFASLFCLWALVLLLLGGEAAFEKQGIIFLELIGSYIVGGAGAGAVVGFFRPLLKWGLGAAVVGILAAIPVGLAFDLTTAGNRWMSVNSVLTVGTFSVLLGASGGLALREVMGKQIKKG